MNQTVVEYAERRAALAAEIARQRRDLFAAYQNLERPIHYAEYGIKGVSFIRRNQWIFLAAPTAFSLFTSLFGLRKGKSSAPAPEGKRRSVIGKVAGRAVQAYQLYRRIRPFFS